MGRDKFRVVQILFGGAYGGIERWVQWFAQEADRTQFDYHFLFIRKGGPILDLISEMGYPTEVVDWKNNRNIFDRIRLIRTLLKIQPDLIHVHEQTTLNRFFMKIATGVPIISSQHIFLGINNKISALFIRLDEYVTSLIIANSKYTARKFSELIKQPLSKIQIINFGINPDIYKFCGNGLYTKGENKKILNITFIGRLLEYKGVLHIPLIARILLNNGENFNINVIGDGPMMESCKNLSSSLNVEENIKFLGWQSNIVEILHETDLLISLSLIDETFGLVIIEALASGVPIFAYSGGGIDEILANAPYGWIIPKGDYKEMAASIMQKKTQCLNCDKFAGYKFVKENFDLRRAVEETERVYKKYIKE